MPDFDGRCGRIFHDSWLPDGEARCAVVVLHGYGEHLGLYDPLARRLVTDGHAVHAFDAVGHGRSDGERAVITSWDHVGDEARPLLGLVRTLHPRHRSSSSATPAGRSPRPCSRCATRTPPTP